MFNTHEVNVTIEGKDFNMDPIKYSYIATRPPTLRVVAFLSRLWHRICGQYRYKIITRVEETMDD